MLDNCTLVLLVVRIGYLIFKIFDINFKQNLDFSFRWIELWIAIRRKLNDRAIRIRFRHAFKIVVYRVRFS